MHTVEWYEGGRPGWDDINNGACGYAWERNARNVPRACGAPFGMFVYSKYPEISSIPSDWAV
jgi:hypothetical protein